MAERVGPVDGDRVVPAVQNPDIARFLDDLAAQGIRVALAGDRLRCTGPEALLRGPLGDAIRDRKPGIIAHLAALTDSAPIPVLDRDEAPLSPAQMRLWVAERIHPESAHHIPFAVEAQGRLDPGAVERALSRIMARHAVLRMRIGMRDGVPFQRTDADTTAPVRLIDGDPDALIAAEATRRFDLEREPPLRLAILRRASDRHVLLFTLHHIAADGGSTGILMAEFAAFYCEALTGLPASLPPPAIQYGDYAAFQQAAPQIARQDRQLAYWRDRLADLPVTQLPTDFPRPPTQSHDGALHPVAIPPELVARLRAIGAARGTSLLTVLLAAFKLLVCRCTGQRDLVVGIPSANRSRPETERLVGLFVNPLPIRSRIDPAAGFHDLLDHVRDGLLGAMDHQDLPFERLVDAFQTHRDPGSSPLFQLKFQLDHAPAETLAMPGLNLRRLPRAGGIARHDLSLDLVEGPHGVSGHVEYCTALFRPGTIAALSGHYLTLLGSIADAPDRPVATLALLSPEQRHLQLVTWNDSARPLDPAERFPALFEAQAAATPDAVAVEYVDGDRVVTESYAALNARANRLAHALRARGAGPDSIVGIALDRGPDMAAAWLGVLKSGAAWLPLDPAYPAERLAYMLTDSGAALVLTASGIALPEGTPRWNLDLGWPGGSDANPVAGTDPEDLAYLIYTSGSTGRPKGVEVPHAGLVNLARDKIATLDLRPGDRVLSFFSFSFDASIPDLILGLGGGARLILSPAEDVLPGPGLSRLLRDRRATHLTITPSALAGLPAEDLPDLRMVLVGGEAPSPELIARWSAGRLFINAYGPTECTVNASMVPCGNGHPLDATLRAPANKQLHILDEHLELLPVGCPGELCIAGLGVARGYRGRPGQTAAVFLPDPHGPRGARLYRTGDRALRLPDGRIRLLGRIDDQVKFRGFRIEPAEIARLCETHPQIATAIIAPRDLPGIGTRLVAWLVAPGPRPDDAILRGWLRDRLPRHMVPEDFVWLDRLPLTVNGKLDQRALPDPEPRAARGRAPQGPVEQALAGIFADLLGIDAPGTEDDFFDLGGNSLMATRLVTAIEDRFGIALRVAALFESSSIAALARRIDAAGPVTATEDWRADLPLPDDIRPARPIQPPARLPDCVLMTGATGFVGAHLLDALLSRPGRRVLCLTRRGGIDALEQALARWGISHPDLALRVVALRGDLAQPGLGLSPGDRARILAEAGAILHCGAEVHHLSPYRSLRAANVGGTVAIIRLATEAGMALHHMSTLSALTPGDRPIAERCAAADLPPPQGGYNLTKWVAEQLVAEAGRRGLPVTIHRLGSISGHSVSGAFNPADILCRQLQGYIASGCAPEGEALLNLLPVDEMARAVLHLADRPDAAGRVYHLTRSAPVPAEMLFRACAAEGLALRRLPGAEWQALLRRIARHEPDHPLYPLTALGGAQGFAGKTWPYACHATRAALDSVLPETPLDDALLRRYVRALSPLPAEEPVA